MLRLFGSRALGRGAGSVAGAAVAAAGRATPVASSRVRLGGLRGFNFASTEYDACFNRDGIPVPDGPAMRAAAVKYIAAFDSSQWESDPVRTILRGEVLADAAGAASATTVDAFQRGNGRIVYSTPDQVDAVIAHMRDYVPPSTDLRAAVRAIEQDIFDQYAGFLIGNQALDFSKQDGVTEMEESIEANVVEQRLNDQLFAAESAGVLKIDRTPAYVGCVSNFSNFLDLFRKTLRNVELGVPVVVLSRSNTTQHMYRWTQMLLGLMATHGIDEGMVTYLSAELSEQQRLFQAASSRCPMYFTGSRPVAEALRQQMGPVMASTGGPNTLVTTELTPEVAEAIRMSACIENSGQCTALRHAVVPGATAEQVSDLFRDTKTVPEASDALSAGEFSAVLNAAAPVMHREAGYTVHEDNNQICFKVSPALPPPGIEEQWRNVYADVTTGFADVTSDAFIDELAGWLVDNQPITVAFNGDYAAARKLWERTGQVVFTHAQFASRKRLRRIQGEPARKARLPAERRGPAAAAQRQRADALHRFAHTVRYLSVCGHACVVPRPSEV